MINPTPAQLKLTHDQALSVVNAMRMSIGYAPLRHMPYGQRNSECYCSIAFALPEIEQVTEYGLLFNQRIDLPYDERYGVVDPEMARVYAEGCEHMGMTIEEATVEVWGDYLERACRSDGSEIGLGLPPALKQFLTYFDAGHYPMLIESSGYHAEVANQSLMEKVDAE